MVEICLRVLFLKLGKVNSQGRFKIMVNWRWRGLTSVKSYLEDCARKIVTARMQDFRKLIGTEYEWGRFPKRVGVIFEIK